MPTIMGVSSSRFLMALSTVPQAEILKRWCLRERQCVCVCVFVCVCVRERERERDVEREPQNMMFMF